MSIAGGAASPGGAGSPGTAGPGDARPPPGAPGRPLGWLPLLPALLAMAWLLAGLPLLLAGRFTPVLMLAVSVPLAAAGICLGLRRSRGQWQARTPWWAAAGVVAVAAAFGAHQLIYHSQQIIVERDPASYIQFAAWISQHGSLPIPQARAAFGGAHQVLHFGSLAFYQVGGNVVPQFMAGLPMVLAAGFWAGGVGAAVLVPPLLGACAAIPRGSSVVIIDGQTAAWFSQVVRGMCGEPAAWMGRRPASVRRVVGAIRQAGRRPVLLGISRSQVAPYGPARHVLALRTREDARLRTSPPLVTRPRPITVWMTEPAQ
jgi:hypothetical protein